MPRIFDNIADDQILLPALQETIQVAYRADFCVGYFNLRGWKSIANFIEAWDGTENNRCRVLVGMQRRPEDEFREAMQQFNTEERIDNATANRLKKKLAEEFREQLTVGVPTDDDENALRQLAAQLKAKKVVVKLYLRHRLHAKLYLLHRKDRFNPIIGYVGSSNLTFSGLSAQGELNLDTTDEDVGKKLAKWFEDRWEDKWCIDISEELIEIIENSWAREDLISPYQIYVKMAYHLSQEARTGLSEFRIPKEFNDRLFEFQKAAVKIAAHHLNKRGGVLIGDVVGLGKTLMATALARIFEDDYGLETLIICPKNLVSMWQENYVDEYNLRAKVISATVAHRELPNLRRYRLVIIDESHNLRNREIKRYRAIQEYIQANESLCVLLSATPYNKTYLDLSNQLRLFVPEDRDLGIRPERLLKEIGEVEFGKFQAGVRTLAGFEKSEFSDDWRELMRLYMIRRTRSFIQQNYAQVDDATGRKYLTFQDGSRNYFPARIPKTIEYSIGDQYDQYSFLYSDEVVRVINELHLPRYGLGQYTGKNADKNATQNEKEMLDNLSRAGRRLMGFCRTNLFKRLESSGQVFLQSLERHILRNYIYLYAIENELPIPIGTQDSSFLDTRTSDVDIDDSQITLSLFEDINDLPDEKVVINVPHVENLDEMELRDQAKAIYTLYQTQYSSKFKWLSSKFFQKRLAGHLKDDAEALLSVMLACGNWITEADAKLTQLIDLITKKHAKEKVLIFTQFADTVNYLTDQLQRRGVKQLAGVTGGSSDATHLAHRFSPQSNNRRSQIRAEDELRVLVATDVLSEGQNLQDCHVVINYDLAWAIIRLIQRAGRVDRIGQQAEQILCYTFLPAEGVERIIRLRERVRQRLHENAEVVGTDEAFFEDDQDTQSILNLYNEKAGILDDEEDTEIDLASYALQIWQNAIKENPRLEHIIPLMSPVSYSTRFHIPNPEQPEGVLLYTRTFEGNDVLAWVNERGEIISESQYAILNAAKCTPDDPALPRTDYHHLAVQAGIRQLIEAQRNSPSGGQLGKPSGARFRTYERLKRYAQQQRGTLFEAEYDSRGLFKSVDEIYRYPLKPNATDTLNRQLKAGISDEQLAELVMNLREEQRLCNISDDQTEFQEPRIICSLGLAYKE